MINIKNFEVEGGRIKENALFRIMVSAPKTSLITPALSFPAVCSSGRTLPCSHP